MVAVPPLVGSDASSAAATWAALRHVVDWLTDTADATGRQDDEGRDAVCGCTRRTADPRRGAKANALGWSVSTRQSVEKSLMVLLELLKVKERSLLAGVLWRSNRTTPNNKGYPPEVGEDRP
jgi:hypothetical protein